MMRYSIHGFTFLIVGALVPALRQGQDPAGIEDDEPEDIAAWYAANQGLDSLDRKVDGSCSISHKASPLFSQYFDAGYNASNIDVAKDSICLRGATQWANWACGNFAHALRGTVAPAYTLLQQRGLLHPCMRVKIETQCGDVHVKNLIAMVFESRVTVAQHCSSTDLILNLDTTPYLTRGASTTEGDSKCERMPGKHSSSMHAAFMFSHGLDGGVVPRSERALNILFNVRSASSRDITNWDDISSSVTRAVAQFSVKVEKTDIGKLTMVNQASLVAKTDVLIMHHGAANNHRYWLAPDSVFVETQPPNSWFCGHAFGNDEVNYILSTNHDQTAGECISGQPISICNPADCTMYTQPKPEFAALKNQPRTAESKRWISMLVRLLDGYEKEKVSFKQSLDSVSLEQTWLKQACRGSALQLVEN